MNLWLAILLLLIVLFFMYHTYNSEKEPDSYVRPRTIQNDEDWMVQAEKDYNMPMSYPMVTTVLESYGIPKSEIEKNKETVDQNLMSIKSSNLESLEEKKLDPKTNPPKYGITPAILYKPGEFLMKNTGLLLPAPSDSTLPQSSAIIPIARLPEPQRTLNYTRQSLIPIYNQNDCGCCWAVSPAVVLNYELFKNPNYKTKLISYAQELTDCINNKSRPPFDSMGCQGGYPTEVFVYNARNKDLTICPNTQQYLSLSTKTISTCGQRPSPSPSPVPEPPVPEPPVPEPSPDQGQSLDQSNRRLQVIPFEIAGIITLTNQGFSYFATRTGSEQVLRASRTDLFIPNADQVKQIKTILSNNGPMVIAINADDNLTRYVGNNIPLPRGQANHAVTLVGYDVDNNGTERWIIQNSWSTNWGEKGIFYSPIRNSYITYIVGMVQPGTPIANLYP